MTSNIRIFSCVRNFATHTRFQIQCVLFWIWVANLWLGDLNNHVCYEISKLFGGKSKCLNRFWLRESVLGYYWGAWLLVVNHMLSERLLFVFRTPFIGNNMWSIKICTCGFLDSLLGHTLCAWFSPQTKHSCLDLQVFTEWPKHPGGGLPYVGYTGMCHRPGSIFHFQKSRTGPKFWSFTSEQALPFEVLLQNRILFWQAGLKRLAQMSKS